MKKSIEISKQDQLIRMLMRAKGARTDMLVKKLGWQPHTVRAAVSRLRKQGHQVQSTKAGGAGGTLYSIAVVSEGKAADQSGSTA